MDELLFFNLCHMDENVIGKNVSFSYMPEYYFFNEIW